MCRAFPHSSSRLAPWNVQIFASKSSWLAIIIAANQPCIHFLVALQSKALFLRKIIFVRWTCRSYLFSDDLFVTDPWFYLSQSKAWIFIMPTDFSRRQRQWERTHFIYFDSSVWAMLWYITSKTTDETETRTFVFKAPESILPKLFQLNLYYPMGLVL